MARHNSTRLSEEVASSPHAFQSLEYFRGLDYPGLWPDRWPRWLALWRDVAVAMEEAALWMHHTYNPRYRPGGGSMPNQHEMAQFAFQLSQLYRGDLRRWRRFLRKSDARLWQRTREADRLWRGVMRYLPERAGWLSKRRPGL